MSTNFPPVNQVFDDLEKFLNYCRFEGKVFDERFLYNEHATSWQSYKKWQYWMQNKNKRNNTRRN